LLRLGSLIACVFNYFYFRYVAIRIGNFLDPAALAFTSLAGEEFATTRLATIRPESYDPLRTDKRSQGYM
jgi:hypothetical protein